MDGLETQLGKIYIYNRKLSRSYVSVESEEVPGTGAEVFSILEVGSLNSAAVPQYEKITALLAASLKKSYSHENQDAFENAVASANQQLASCASDEKSAWSGTISVLLAARQGNVLSVATSGKVHAYLFRDGQLSDLADSPEKQNPLKVLENFAVGKVQKGDFLIFSTPQLFNYVSAERVQALLSSLPLGAACDSIAALIKENADEQTSFGTLILELGYPGEFEVQDTRKVSAVLAGNATLVARTGAAWSKVKSGFSHTVLIARTVKVRNFKDLTVSSVAEHAKKYTDLEALRSLPRAKKFFLAAAAACVVLLVANVALAIHSENAKKAQAKVSQQLSTVSGEISNANSAFMYGDSATASQLLSQAQANLSKVPAGTASGASSGQLTQLNKEAGDMANAINHVNSANATQLVTYNGASIDTFVLTGSTAYLVNRAGDLFVPYSLTAGNSKTADSFTVAAPPITNIAAINGAIIFTDSTGSLYQVGSGATVAVKQPGQLPAGSTGLAFYGSPTRVYTVDRAANAIVSTTLASTKAPAQYLKQAADLSSSLDLAIDGSVYVLGPSSIQKFTSGTLRAFSSPSFTLSSSATIFTDAALNSLYVLDTQNNGIVEVDKATGKILEQYRPANVKNIKAFAVDASSPSNPTIYVLSGKALYKLAP